MKFHKVSLSSNINKVQVLLSWIEELLPVFESMGEVCFLAHDLHKSRVNESSCYKQIMNYRDWWRLALHQVVVVPVHTPFHSWIE